MLKQEYVYFRSKS